MAVGVLEGDRVDRRAVDRGGQVRVGFALGLGIVLAVEGVWIAAAHVHDLGDARGHAVEAAVEGLYAIVERLPRPSGEDRLVDLDPFAAGLGQRQHLFVEGLGQVGGQPGVVVVEEVGRGVGHGHGAGHGDLDRLVGEGLGEAPVARQEGFARLDRPDDRRQLRLVGAAAHRPPGQAVEVEALKVPAVVVDVVLAPDLAVGGDVDAGVHLVFDRLLDAEGEALLRLLAHGLDGLEITGGWPVGVGPGLGAEPVRHGHEVWLGIGPDGGGQKRHGVPFCALSYDCRYCFADTSWSQGFRPRPRDAQKKAPAAACSGASTGRMSCLAGLLSAS